MPKADKKEKYRAWSYTLRPLNGVTDTDISKFLKRIKKMKNIIGGKAIIEKQEDECHIHLALYFRHDQLGDSIRKVWTRLFRYDWDSRTPYSYSTFGSASYEQNSMYNEDWVNKYLTKDETCTIIYDNLPNEETRLKCYKDRPGYKGDQPGQRTGDGYYRKLEKLWYDIHGLPPMYITEVSNFLARTMYIDRKIRCITSLRRLREVTHTLLSYLRKSATINYYDNRGYNGQDGFESFSSSGQSQANGGDCKANPPVFDANGDEIHMSS